MKPRTVKIYIYIYMWKKKSKTSTPAELTKTSVPTQPDWTVTVNPYSYSCLLLWIVLQPWHHRDHCQAQLSSQMSFVWKVQIYWGLNKCGEESHFLYSHFLGDTIKAMASMGKWINATYTRLLRCWYIWDDFKYLKAEHLNLKFFFNLYRLQCAGWFRVWLRMPELKQLSS